MKKLIAIFCLMAFFSNAQTTLLLGKNGGTGVANTNHTLGFANDSVRVGGTYYHTLKFPASNTRHWFPAATGTVALTSDLGSYVPLAGTATNSPLYGPIEFSVGTTALWQDTSGAGYYVGYADNKNIGSANEASYTYYNDSQVDVTTYKTDGSAGSVSTTTASVQIISQSPSMTHVATVAITPSVSTIDYNYGAYQGLTYGASTATTVAANQGNYSILHRSAGDARWLSSSYSVAPTSVTAPITLISNILALTSTGTGSVVLSSGATLTTPTLGVASATSLSLTGAGGSGFLSLPTQTAQPSSPSSGTILFSNLNSKLSWRGSGNTYMKTLDAGNNSADRVYSLPNRDVKIDSLTTSTSTALNGVIQGNGSVLSSVSTVGSGSVALQGAITSYTPTWSSAGTPPSIGNGSITGYYIKTGKKVDVWIAISTGSTTTFGSANVWTFTLPTTANNSFFVGGSAIGLNAGVAFYSGAISATSTTVVSIGGPNTGNYWMSTIPGTWGSPGSSFMKIYITYFE